MIGAPTVLREPLSAAGGAMWHGVGVLVRFPPLCFRSSQGRTEALCQRAVTDTRIDAQAGFYCLLRPLRSVLVV